MIEGLKFKLTGSALKAHLEQRAQYHKLRAKEKADALPELEAAIQAMAGEESAEIRARAKMSSSYRFDPNDAKTELEGDIRNHQVKANRFAWMAAHLFEEVYQLDVEDLHHLEINSRF